MPPDTRTALIDAATRLLDEGGVEAVTLREVGRLAGVSHNAPYKHFASKQALLAAIAARDLTRRNEALTATVAAARTPQAALRKAMHDYIAWALGYPARFRLVFGAWTVEFTELAAAAQAAQTTLVTLVAAAQEAGTLPAGDPVRLAALLRALAHGAADLASTGHLTRDKTHASADQLADDLVAYLRAATEVTHPNGG